jgi:hypothetical protein
MRTSSSRRSAHTTNLNSEIERLIDLRGAVFGVVLE